MIVSTFKFLPQWIQFTKGYYYQFIVVNRNMTGWCAIECFKGEINARCSINIRFPRMQIIPRDIDFPD